MLRTCMHQARHRCDEHLTIALPPVVNTHQRLANRDVRSPSGMLRELGVVRHIDELIARTELVALVVDALAGKVLDLVDQLKKRYRVLRSTTYVVDLSCGGRRVLAERVKHTQQIVDAKHI